MVCGANKKEDFEGEGNKSQPGGCVKPPWIAGDGLNRSIARLLQIVSIRVSTQSIPDPWRG